MIPFLRLFLSFAAGLVLVARAGQTVVSISGEEFLINGTPTYAGQFWQGHKVQGLLMNARRVQGTFDDRDPATAGPRAYPDTGKSDADRDTTEFIAAMPSWKSHGLLAFTLNLQDGPPEGYLKDPPRHDPAFAADGSLDPAYLGRLGRILDRADDLGMVVILGLFSFGQDERLADEAAVLAAVDNTTAWLAEKAYRHVLIEIDDGSDVRFHHAVLRPDRVHELIARVQKAKPGGRRFLAGTSFSGGTLPTTNVVKSADFLLLHGNGGDDPRKIADRIRRTRALPGYKAMPVLFNEDAPIGSDRPLDHFTAALTERAGWGCLGHRMKGEGFAEGFQSVPVVGSIGSDGKRAFFDRLAQVTGSLPRGAVWSEASGTRWWKGNLHTHTLWSDGDDYPEMVAAWYKDHGYHFLGLSDHNLQQQGQRWLTVTANKGGGEALSRYRAKFGPDRVEERTWLGTNQVRLQPYSEFAPLLDEPGRFLMVPSEEITSGHMAFPVHINATNLRELVPGRGGSNVLDVMQGTVDAVLKQRGRTGQPMFPHINHPNFGWGITAEDLMRVVGERFFEVYNGHPSVHNEGDATRAGMERVWDIVLTWRLGVLGLPPMFGFAVDDSHNYHAEGGALSNPGRGWLRVRARTLSAESLVASLERGDFYATSGVELEDQRRDGRRVTLRIAARPGVSYRTQFIGTRRGFKAGSEPVRNAAGEKVRATGRYDAGIGEVFAEVDGPVATYEMKGDELYVRAKVTSSQMKVNPYVKGETEAAWVQPVIP